MKILKYLGGLVLCFALVTGCRVLLGTAVAASQATSKTPSPAVALVEVSGRVTGPVPKVEVSRSSPAIGGQRYDVGNGVSLEIPLGWHFMTHAQIVENADRANAKLVTPDNSPKTTTLAANANVDPSVNEATIRASFVPKDFDDQDLRSVTQSEWDAACAEMTPQMTASMAAAGFPLVGSPTCSVKKVAGRLAVSQAYQRRGIDGDSTWSVEILKFPLSNTIAMLTFSSKDGAVAGETAIKIAKDSLTFP